MISCVFIRYYTENFTNENPFHKIVHILLAVLWRGNIAGLVGTFVMHHFMALCVICSWRTSFLIPACELWVTVWSVFVLLNKFDCRPYFIDTKSCFFKIICDWRLLCLCWWNLVGNDFGFALHMKVTLMKQTWAVLCFCFLDNSTYRQFPTLSSYSHALNYIIYPVYWRLIRIVLIALESFKCLKFTDCVLSRWLLDRKVDCLKSLANRSNAWSLSV